MFLATKVLGSHLRYDQVLRAAEDSLRKLNVDVIDLYQVHWPNSRVPIAETMRAMEELVDRGMVRYIGVSNFSRAELQDAQRAMTRYPIVSNQVLYSLKAQGDRGPVVTLLPGERRDDYRLHAPGRRLPGGEAASAPRPPLPGTGTGGPGRWAIRRPRLP